MFVQQGLMESLDRQICLKLYVKKGMETYCINIMLKLSSCLYLMFLSFWAVEDCCIPLVFVLLDVIW